MLESRGAGQLTKHGVERVDQPGDDRLVVFVVAVTLAVKSRLQPRARQEPKTAEEPTAVRHWVVIPVENNWNRPVEQTRRDFGQPAYQEGVGIPRADVDHAADNVVIERRQSRSGVVEQLRELVTRDVVPSSGKQNRVRYSSLPQELFEEPGEVVELSA